MITPPTGFSTATVVRLDGGTADRIITGLATGTPGALKIVTNVGLTNALILASESTASAAAGRFAFTSDVRLAPRESQIIRYDVTLARWGGVKYSGVEADRIRPCSLIIGSMSVSASPLPSDDDSPSACPNSYGRDWEIRTVTCKTNAGSLMLQPILTGGTATSILTSDCPCGTTWTACLVNGTPIVHSFSGAGATCTTPPCDLSVNIQAAGGVAACLSGEYCHWQAKVGQL